MTNRSEVPWFTGVDGRDQESPRDRGVTGAGLWELLGVGLDEVSVTVYVQIGNRVVLPRDPYLTDVWEEVGCGGPRGSQDRSSRGTIYRRNVRGNLFG